MNADEIDAAVEGGWDVHPDVAREWRGRAQRAEAERDDFAQRLLRVESMLEGAEARVAELEVALRHAQGFDNPSVEEMREALQWEPTDRQLVAIEAAWTASPMMRGGSFGEAIA